MSVEGGLWYSKHPAGQLNLCCGSRDRQCRRDKGILHAGVAISEEDYGRCVRENSKRAASLCGISGLKA